MGQDIVKTGARQVDEIRDVNRNLIEKALRMRCLSYLSQVKAQLLTKTIYEVDKSKKNLLDVNREINMQRDLVAKQKRLLEQGNQDLQQIRVELERRVAQRTSELELSNQELEAEIDQRKRMEIALRESETRFRGLLESAPDAMVIVNQQGTIELVNAQAEKLFGYRRNELVEQPIELLLPDEYRDHHLQHQLAYFEHPDLRHMGIGDDLHARHKDGHTIPVEITLSPLKTNTGILVSSAIRDITERKRNEAELIRYRSHLEDLVAERTVELESRNAELESFSYTLAHDLRAPLRSVASFSQMVLQDAEQKLGASDVAALCRVVSAAKHMAQLIDDILALAEISRGQLRCTPVNLSKQAEQVIDRLRVREPNRQVHFTNQPELWVGGDQRLLGVMLEHLIQNAWKYTKVRTQAHIDLGVEQRSNETVYYLRDDGVGFDMRHVDKLFHPFQRLHNSDEFEGTGVGLAIVQRVLERHGGHVWAEGAVDEGATIYFTLPASKNHPSK